MPQLVDVTPGSSEWLAARREGVTATDIVTILGLSSHDSVYSLFWRKLGQVPDPEDTDRWALGRALEPYVVHRWIEAAEGLLADLDGAKLYRNGDRPWQMSTPDRLVSVPAPGPLECKSWADADARSWEAGPPPAVRAQILWQMDTLDVTTGHWAVVFLPSGRFQHGVITHDPAFIPDGPDAEYPCPVCRDIKLMREAGAEFYARMRLELPPPDADSSAATLAAVRARFVPAPAKQAEVDADSWQDYKRACQQIKVWETVKNGAEVELREQAGDATELTVDGEIVIRRVVSDQNVKAHTRHMDYYRRVKTGDDSE